MRSADRLGKPEGLLADAGYFSEDNVNYCEAEEITPYISDSRQRHNLPLEERFKPPLSCPENADALAAMVHRLQTTQRVKRCMPNANPR